ncbi:putative serine/threonine-protein kinase-like protein CCR3 [Ricinus communis]|uniref:putative serine/threonine-protein kinase-like protein CCR3 n=1 Tax=Ricinus communis TaxID=3988 RepID=UPI00201AA808|nr:putative serine/threonine-protein kinase-like protein CCR3 [Ricinus communis]
MAQTVRTNVKEDANDSEKARSGANRVGQKAPICTTLLMSFTVLIISITDLVYKGNPPENRQSRRTRRLNRADEFTLDEIAAATNDFSLQTKIGNRIFGTVYRGKLADGREAVIKRGERGQTKKLYQEKQNEFESELEFLLRLHHKHLVRLIGYCDNGVEKLLVFEHIENGSLYDQLHVTISSMINSSKVRIKTALDAAREIQYLMQSHQDWTAIVSEFGLSLKAPESELDYRPIGSVRYIDPEYYLRNIITAKNDVCGFGVILLELLTGKIAMFKDDNNGGTLTCIIDFAAPRIIASELVNILDPKVNPPKLMRQRQ